MGAVQASNLLSEGEFGEVRFNDCVWISPKIRHIVKAYKDDRMLYEHLVRRRFFLSCRALFWRDCGDGLSPSANKLLLSTDILLHLRYLRLGDGNPLLHCLSCGLDIR